MDRAYQCGPSGQRGPYKSIVGGKSVSFSEPWLDEAPSKWLWPWHFSVLLAMDRQTVSPNIFCLSHNQKFTKRFDRIEIAIRWANPIRWRFRRTFVQFREFANFRSVSFACAMVQISRKNFFLSRINIFLSRIKFAVNISIRI
jgi:hypothetical protein